MLCISVNPPDFSDTNQHVCHQLTVINDFLTSFPNQDDYFFRMEIYRIASQKSPMLNIKDYKLEDE